MQEWMKLSKDVLKWVFLYLLKEGIYILSFFIKQKLYF